MINKYCICLFCFNRSSFKKGGHLSQDLKKLKDMLLFVIDPPGPGRIGDHHFHTSCPSVRHKNHATTIIVSKTKQNYHATWDLVGHNIRKTFTCYVTKKFCIFVMASHDIFRISVLTDINQHSTYSRYET